MRRVGDVVWVAWTDRDGPTTFVSRVRCDGHPRGGGRTAYHVDFKSMAFIEEDLLDSPCAAFGRAQEKQRSIDRFAAMLETDR